MKILLYCISIAILFIACNDYEIDELLDAPEQVDINGYNFIIHADLAQAVGPYQNIYARITVSEINSNNFPSWLDANEMWVIDGDNVWHDDLIDDGWPLVPWSLPKRNENIGPEWDPGIYVDVVVQLVDNSTTYLIKESDVYIYGYE